MPVFTLTPRQQIVLSLVIERYKNTGLGSSSKDIEKRLVGDTDNAALPFTPRFFKGVSSLRCSAPTLRTDLARLSVLHLLTQAHPRAGRFPSSQGLRYAVDHLLRYQLRPWDINRLESALLRKRGQEYIDSMVNILCEMSGQAVIMAVPRFPRYLYRDVGIARVAPRKLTLYFVSPGGEYHYKLVYLDVEIPSSELPRIQLLLKELLVGRTLQEVQQLLKQELEQGAMNIEYSKKRAVEIAYRGLPDTVLSITLKGIENLAKQPYLQKVIVEIIAALEEQSNLEWLAKQWMAKSDVEVLYQGEHDFLMAQLTLLGGGWQGMGGGAGGAMGIVGGDGMDCARLVPLLSHALSMYQRHLQISD